MSQIEKNSLQNTQFEYELQARIYEVLKENSNSPIELQSSELIKCVTKYFDTLIALKVLLLLKMEINKMLKRVN